ncbi:iduronate-2-sulfatase, partial [Verrucomicrobia bacterium]|nr:iduronate-2-sulfatase [Verrucomicrobiota bacterium]
WHLGEHSIWGKHALFEESLHSPLIVSYTGIPKPGVMSNAMVETVDIFPTLAKLAGVPSPDFVSGVSLVPILKSPKKKGHPAFAYKSNAKTIRTETHRLIAHKGGDMELYDHRKPDGETRNIAESEPKLVQELLKKIEKRLK